MKSIPRAAVLFVLTLLLAVCSSAAVAGDEMLVLNQWAGHVNDSYRGKVYVDDVLTVTEYEARALLFEAGAHRCWIEPKEAGVVHRLQPSTIDLEVFNCTTHEFKTYVESVEYSFNDLTFTMTITKAHGTTRHVATNTFTASLPATARSRAYHPKGVPIPASDWDDQQIVLRHMSGAGLLAIDKDNKFELVTSPGSSAYAHVVRVGGFRVNLKFQRGYLAISKSGDVFHQRSGGGDATLVLMRGEKGCIGIRSHAHGLFLTDQMKAADHFESPDGMWCLVNDEASDEL